MFSNRQLKVPNTQSGIIIGYYFLNFSNLIK